ncbi:MAG TPA: helix-turn-helix domain-containing protein [Accumulibacter sp.]|uniref:winged helix-turn-helix transcriptional regulator n=1 Tax=Accumulibacter sp. TaxID=2053492 RepID=UPI002B5AC077|nr:helix-turn-helix domain-containing protein [Accumulibacter sp.]HRD90606.1 helix-turn-helix domain-containing protein [Accumulibacter sp.]
MITAADTTADPDADYRSRCPLASALDLLGDKWTLIIVRDMIAGKRRYGEFLSSPERIPSNILAGRLRRLDDAGIVDKRLYQENPPRHEYLLTRKGAELLPVLQQLAAWGHRHLPGRWTPPAWFFEATPEDLCGAGLPRG